MRQAVVFVSASTLGAVYFAVHGGTGRFVCFFEAGRGGLFFFPRRDGAVCFFFRGGTGRLFFFFRRDGTGRCFFFFRGPGRDGSFWQWQLFWRDGAKSLHGPAKGGLNRPASRPCKALVKMRPLGLLALNTLFFRAING